MTTTKAALMALGLGWAVATSASAQAAGSSAPASDGAQPAAGGVDESFAFHAQSTFIYQGHDSFASPYRGANSLAIHMQSDRA